MFLMLTVLLTKKALEDQIGYPSQVMRWSYHCGWIRDNRRIFGHLKNGGDGKERKRKRIDEQSKLGI